jgi:hypothetical protein
MEEIVAKKWNFEPKLSNFAFPLLWRGVGVRPNKEILYKSVTPIKFN